MPSTLRKSKVSKRRKLHFQKQTIENDGMIKDAKVDFVSLTAHQLKRPLSELRLSLGMLFDGDFGQISEQQGYIIKKILERVELLIVLVNDMMQMTRVEDGKSHRETLLTDPEELVDSVIATLSGEIMRKHLDFRFQKPRMKPPAIVVDKEKLFLALQNVIDNAVKYTPMGGRIVVSLDCSPKQLEFRIEDSGIGIPEIQQKKMFTKFFRGSNATSLEVVGSGLGLFIAKNIIESHHGKIWFVSKENFGTTFYIDLPLANHHHSGRNHH